MGIVLDAVLVILVFAFVGLLWLNFINPIENSTGASVNILSSVDAGQEIINEGAVTDEETEESGGFWEWINPFV